MISLFICTVTSTRPDSFCLHGLRSGKVCCDTSCGHCSSGFSEMKKKSSETNVTSNCSAHKILQNGRICINEWDVGCLVPGVGEAAEHLCFLIHIRKLIRKQVTNVTTCATINSTCIEDGIQNIAKIQKTSVHDLKIRIMHKCLSKSYTGRADVVKYVMNKGCQSSEFGTVVSGPVGSLPSVWLAAIVRDQSHMLHEWILWHLLLGVSHILLYDNGSMEQHLLRDVLDPFIEAGAVTLMSMPGHDIQITAYNDAIRIASLQVNPPFVACWDVDERVVPHGWGCLTNMLSHCTEEKKCAGMRLNTRVTTGSRDKLKPPITSESKQTLLHQLNYNTGSFRHPSACCVVKTIVRPSTHRTWKTPHSTFPKKGWCHFDEFLKCPSMPNMPFVRMPQTSQFGFILHMQCRTLIDWVVKKSLTGRVDTSSRNTCPTCFASLEKIYKEYEVACLMNLPKDDPSVFNHHKAFTFVRLVDSRLSKVMQEFYS